ncbi:MAG: isoleucine--tRNA ligase [Candidatus Hodarchaeota archaeon]
MAKAPTYKPQFLKELKGTGSFNLPKKEVEMLEWWRKNEIYRAIKENEEDKPEFRFIDGPPYTTGSIHLGTAWNKILKDIIIRYKRMQGFRVTDTPGYDTHGLPIEVQMEKQLKTKNKKDILTKFGLSKFIDMCKDFAMKNLYIMNDQFRRLGCEFWNWDRPYVTLTEGYIQGAWWMIKKAYEKDLLYLGNRPLNTCPRCETALAKHEYEYKNRSDDSIYVKFKSVDEPNTYFVIWTTTPWTLVANEAIMANPELEYVKVKGPNDEIWIMCKNLVNMFMQAIVEIFPKIIETFTGDKLKGKRYIHPLLEEVPIQKEMYEENKKVHSIIMSTEFVSATDGTGLVHCAPGHGPEDFQVGHVEQGIPAFCPVDEQGNYFPEGGKFAGKNVFESNNEIIGILKEKGTLIHSTPIEHEYAHCWRCKQPLVYRIMDQWYLKTNELSGKMIEENRKIEWFPDFAGTKNFENWLQNLQDWCISRQRFWGIPLPIWLCDNEGCDEMFVAGSRAEIEEISGQKPEDLHRPWIDEVTFACKKCKKGTMKRVEDLVDVWLDSGCVSWASNEAIYGDDYKHGPKEYDDWRVADWIIEGKDQIRGWFNSLMSCAVLSSDRPAYKAVAMHGFVTLEGEPMHKSRGNVVPPEEAIDRRGAETYRLYCTLNMSMGEDLNFYWREFDDSYKTINTLWNVYYYAKEMFSLHGFKPKCKDLPELMKANKTLEDIWFVSRLQTVLKEVTADLERYDMSRYAKDLKAFIINDISKWYLKLVKSRLSEDGVEESRNNAMEVLYHVLKSLNLMMAPLFPTLSEIIQNDFLNEYVKESLATVHMGMWPKVNDALINEDLEKEMELVERLIEKVRNLREDNNIKLKWPCKTLVIAGEKVKPLEKFTGTFKKEANMKSVEFKKDVSKADGLIIDEVSDVKVGIDTTVDEDLMAERFFRDFFRQLQFLRKAAKLKVGELIDLEIQTASKSIMGSLQKYVEDMKTKAYVENLDITSESTMSSPSFEETLKYCPVESCLVPVKSKTIENAKKMKKQVVSCSYCKKENKIEDLATITVKFTIKK